MHKRINLIPKLNLSKTMANPKRVYTLILSKTNTRIQELLDWSVKKMGASVF